jgi:hypothetical protein
MAMGAVIFAIDIVGKRYSKGKVVSTGSAAWSCKTIVSVVCLGRIMQAVLVFSGF